MRVFLDANVLFSASNAGSNIQAFVNTLCTTHTVVTSHHALQEAQRNISLKRPQWERGFRALMKHIGCVMDAPLKIDVMLADKDMPILGAAIAAHCDYLLTGDKKDFGHLYGSSVAGVTIVSYTMLAEKVLTERTPQPN